MKSFLLYALTFPNGKLYLGITARGLSRRMALHRSHAKTNRKTAVSAAIRKYGLPTPKVLVVAPSWDYVSELEKKAIIAFNSRSPQGYNLTDGGEGAYGTRWTAAHYAAAAKRRGVKTGRQNRGWKHTPEALAKISEAGRGRVFSTERRAKIGESKRGNRYAAGIPMPAGLKERLREISKTRIVSVETRTRMSEAAKQRGMSASIRKHWYRNEHAHCAS